MSEELRDITGVVFDIKKYAIHDGPGIRSTVFLKGCSLRCRWCHNPESWSIQPELMFSRNRCIQCGDCIRSCPNQAIQMESGQYPQTNPSLCTISGQCVNTCPTQARKIVGHTISVEQVLREVMKDVVFYDESGGGVTFSGGEPLMQPEFLEAMLILFHEMGLHTAVDTSLHADQAVLEKILPYSNLFLCDIKHIDTDKHKEWTGAENTQILANLHYLAKSEIEMIIRIPIIPGFNDTIDDLKKIAVFIDSLGIVKHINLLPYRSGGVSKGHRLINPRDILQCTMPDVDKMSELEEAVEGFGFQVKER